VSFRPSRPARPASQPPRIEFPAIVARDRVPDEMTGARPGVHVEHGRRVGFIPEPESAGDGTCWWCRTERISAYPPLCGACARWLWGDAIFRPSALVDWRLRRLRGPA